MNGLKVGEVAKEAGVNIETLRFYERGRLLPPPPRSEGNYRLYSEDSVRRLRFIKRAKELGFTLKEIKDLLSLRAAPRSRCVSVRRQAEEKLKTIDEKIQILQGMRKALGRLIEECAGQGPATECPILGALDQPLRRLAS